MPYTTRRLILCAACAALLFFAAAPRAHAQMTTPAVVPAPATPDFMSRYHFHLSAAAVAMNDPRFSWETHFGGDLDVADYVFGRSSILVDYEPSSATSFARSIRTRATTRSKCLRLSARGETEIAGVFHHVSRHLSDRPKRFAIAWNVLGVRVLRRVSTKASRSMWSRARRKVVQNSFVDYTWTGDLDLMIRRPLSPASGCSRTGSATHSSSTEPSPIAIASWAARSKSDTDQRPRGRPRAFCRRGNARRCRSNRPNSSALGACGVPARQQIAHSN